MTVVVHLGAEDAELTLLLVFTQLFSFHTEFHPQIFEIEQVELLDISQNQISLDHYFSINALQCNKGKSRNSQNIFNSPISAVMGHHPVNPANPSLFFVVSLG